MQRLSDWELTELYEANESERLERKSNFSSSVRTSVCEAVCAFANDLPNYQKAGVVVIGANDDGSPSGLPITQELLTDIGNIKTDGNILPIPVMTVEKRKIRGSEMAVITVTPSDMPPVKYKGRIWVRTGARKSIASEQEERILSEKRRHKNLPYDLYPISEATIHDLSRSVFEDDYLPAAFAPDVLEANNRTYEERLASCRMIVSPDNTTPTLVGLLSLGKKPQNFLPGAYIQFLRLDGTELTDEVIDELKIEGNLLSMLRRCEEKLMSHNRTSVDVTSAPTHIKHSLYPHAALQQLLYNAVLHRTYEKTNTPVRVHWYDDRIEMISPGGPYGNVTIHNFGTPGITDYRNPNIADVMKVFGFVQSFGRGIGIARSELIKNGNPEPEFQTDNGFVRCLVRKCRV